MINGGYDNLVNVGILGLSASELAIAIGKTTRTIRTHMTRLVDAGLVKEIGSGPNRSKTTICSCRQRRTIGIWTEIVDLWADI